MEKERKEEKRPLSFNDLSEKQIKKILSEEAKSNKHIEQELRVAAREMSQQISILLLGSGEAGKSTVLKQLRVLHDSGFGAEERVRYAGIVRRNVVAGMKELVQRALDAAYDFGKLKSLAQDMAEMDEKTAFEDVVGEVRTLLEAAPVKEVLANLARFQIPDSTPFFLSDLGRISSSDYVPTDQDIILSRVRTTSIAEYNLKIDNSIFRFIDVAGQRSERRKWIHFFDGVTAMLFVASLSCYNQQLREDPSVNAMHDQLQLFDAMINGKWFKDAAVILFLNKVDLFEKKLEHVPLDVCFPDYFYGDREHPDRIPEQPRLEHALDYVSLQFMKQKKSDKVVYTHYTCATNTDNIAFVFRAVRDSIRRSILELAD